MGLGSAAAIASGADITPLLPFSSFALVAIVFLSRRISRFLATFVDTLAAVHVLLSGLLLLAAFDAVPFGLAHYVPPTTMAVAAAVSAALIYGAAHIPVVQTITGIGDRYYLSDKPAQLDFGPLGVIRSREGKIGVALLVFIILLNLAQVAISVRFNFWYRDMFNALQAKQQAAFWYQLFVVFVPFAVIWVFAQMVEFAAQYVLRIRWRSHLNTHYVENWLGRGLHYEMQLLGQGTDNPDQRIADDLSSFVDQSYSLSIQILNQVATLVSFVVILWALSAGFTLPGTDVAIPGLLVWLALAYAAIGTWLTHVIGRPLIKLFFQRERVEADYRFSLARIREYGEQIALLGGQHAEGERLHGRFGAIVSNFMSIAWRTIKLESFRLSFRQANVIFPLLIAVPYYFAGKIDFGQIQQTTDAFSSVQAAFNFFILAYGVLAAYKAIIDRLTTFETAMQRLSREHSGHPPIEVGQGGTGAISLDGVSVRLPDARELIHDIKLDLRHGEATLFTGPSGSGKSTLFRTIAGIWPFGSGKIKIPTGDSVLLLPQRPYIPQGTLRDAVAYPAVSGTYTDDQIIDALEAAKLPDFAAHLGDERLWSQTLSLGEQQRLAVARALLAKPDWLFLDEATAALDEKTEAEIYMVLKQRLPDTTVVSIGHRSTLYAFHDRRIDVRKGKDGSSLLIDQEPLAAIG